MTKRKREITSRAVRKVWGAECEGTSKAYRRMTPGVAIPQDDSSSMAGRPAPEEMTLINTNKRLSQR